MRISGTGEFREKIASVSPFPPAAGKTLEFPVMRYMGTLKNPQWMDKEKSK